MVQPWKGCVAQVTEGSNPSLSAIKTERGVADVLFCFNDDLDDAQTSRYILVAEDEGHTH